MEIAAADAGLSMATIILKSQGLKFSTNKDDDHSRHHQFLENITLEGFRVRHDPKEDGNCFFHCCISYLQQYKDTEHRYTAKTLRQNVVQFLR